MRLIVLSIVLLSTLLVGLMTGSVVASWWTDEPRAALQKGSAAPSPVPSETISHQVVRRQPARVQVTPAVLEHESEVERANPGEFVDPEDVERTLRAETEQHDGWFESESTDPRWSYAAEEKLQTSLRAIRESRGGFNVARVECKTSVCRAEVEWHKSDEAPVLVDALAEADYGLGCDVRVYSHKDDGTFSRGRVFYDCTDERAREFQPN